MCSASAPVSIAAANRSATASSTMKRLALTQLCPALVKRAVIAIADKFPALARAFYEAGPNHGRRRLSVYLEAQRARGRLVLDDPDTAAWQFMGMCCHPVTVHMLLSGQAAPGAPRIRSYAEAAVATFLAAYGPRG